MSKKVNTSEGGKQAEPTESTSTPASGFSAVDGDSTQTERTLNAGGGRTVDDQLPYDQSITGD